MKIYKQIAFSYPTSDSAKELGFYKTGCYHIEQTYHNIENSGQSKSFVPHNAEGFTDKHDPDLIALLAEYEGDLHPLAVSISRKDPSQKWRIGE